MHAQKICFAPAFAKLMRCESNVSHHPLRCGAEQFLQSLRVEFGVAGGEMAAGLGRGRDQVKLPVFDALHRRVGDAGLRRIAFVVVGVDRKQRRLDLL
jgi:hypothetical protein